MKKFIFSLCILGSFSRALAQHYQVDTLYKTGSLDNRINVVILGDGFTQDEMPKFADEARKFADFFLKYDPYVRYRDYFNFFAIRTPSKESGVTNPGTAPDAYPDQPVGTKDTFFGASYGSFIHRALQLNKQDLAFKLLASHLPAYDIVVVLVNTKFYGGTGGAMAIFTLHEEASTVGMHEIGHTFGKLKDEYWDSGVFGGEAANMTENSDAATIKWRNWLDTPPIGIFSHGSNGESARWYKPSSGTCLMEFHNQQFCAVCRETTVERLLEYVNPIEKVEPDTAGKVDADLNYIFKLGLLKPIPNTLHVEWRLNGQLLPGSGNEIALEKKQISDMSVLTAAVFDSTGMSRRDGKREIRTHSVTWNLKSSVPGVFRIVSSADSLCAGGELALTAYACPGTLEWSTFESAQTIYIRPSLSGTYEAKCKIPGKPTISAEVSVKLLPLPQGTVQGGGMYFEGQIVHLNASGGLFYQWSGPRNFSADTPGISIPNAKVNNSGTYQVEVKSASGCSVIAKAEVKVEPVLAVSNDPDMSVTVSPNPARDYITIETRLTGKSEITLYDQSGRKLVSESFEQKTTLPLNVTPGMYLYRVTNGLRESTGKVMVQ